MSRDIGDTPVFGPGCFLLSGLIVAGGVQGQFAQDLSGGCFGDDDVLFVDEHEDVFAGIGPSQPDVPQPACVAQRDLPGRVDAVHADPPMTSLPGCQWNRFDGGVVGLDGCFPVQRPVRALMVIDVAEFLELGVEVLQGLCPRLAAEPFLQGLMEPLNLSLGLRVARGPVFLRDFQGVQEGLEAVAAAFAAGEAGGIDQTVVRQGGSRQAVVVGGFEECLADGRSGDGPVGGAGEQVAGVVIEEVQDLGIGAVGQRPVGEIGLPGLVRLRGFETVK